MKAIGGIILLIIIFCLFIKNKKLKKKNLGLKDMFDERNELVKKLLSMLQGHYIDGDADPLKIEGCVVAYHRKNGLLKWEPDYSMYLSKKQNKKDSTTIRGHELHEELLSENVANGNILDFLLAYPGLISKEWPLSLPFWGTIYRRISDGECFVRCLSIRNGKHYWHRHWLKSQFNWDEATIVLK